MTNELGSSLSIITGAPLSEESSLGTLTLPGFIREVTAKYGPREALVFYENGRAIRWSYADVYGRAMDVACALRAGGLGKDERVGVLMTNRPEWISSVFGIAMAGGVACAISTFSAGQLRMRAKLARAAFRSVKATRNFCGVLGSSAIMPSNRATIAWRPLNQVFEKFCSKSANSTVLLLRWKNTTSSAIALPYMIT